MNQPSADEHAEHLEPDLRKVADQVRTEVESFVRESPHVALGLAAALGFVLGGGLTPRRLLRLGIAFGSPALTKAAVGEAAKWLSDTLPPPG